MRCSPALGPRSLVWLLALLLGGACTAYDSRLLPRRDGPEADGGSAQLDASGGKNDADLAPEPDAAASDAGPIDWDHCIPNADPNDDHCTIKCPERCDSQDNDCDGNVDEDADAFCDRAHAKGACNSGRCFLTRCESHYRDCNSDAADGCEVDEDDPNNCGVCGHKCSFVHGLAACINDRCARTACSPGFGDCDANSLDCETRTNTLQNCGGCALACGSLPNSQPSCDPGYCSPEQCSTGFADCNGTPQDGCEQALVTVDHCGSCGKSCDFLGSSDDCSHGVCVAQSCDTGFSDCDGDPSDGCESLNSATHCGACHAACDASLPNVMSASCSDAVCGIDTCKPGFEDCDANVNNGCETALNTLQSCGACGAHCAPAHASGSCAMGGCAVGTCAPGYDDCNSDPSDGCEQPLATLAHCGACNVACSLASCGGGQCTTSICTAPRADCNATSGDGPSSDGCETDLASDSANCGACRNSCAFTAQMPHATLAGCNAGVCRITCAAGFADCNGNYADGCERSITTLSDCGACDVGCSIAHASATCSTGSCKVDHCNTDYADCDSDGISCETALDTANHCGACGTACNLQNALAACGGAPGARSCALSACSQPYYMNCDANAATGCEINSSSDVANCGACRNDCRSHTGVKSASCSNSLCAYSCATGYGDCTQAPGCETRLDTLSDCAGCGVTCARTNATTSCTTGSCVLTGCNGNFGDCNTNPIDGCETALDTAQNCASCGRTCNLPNATSACSAAACTVAVCNPGYADCNQSAADGCERNTSAPASGGQGPCLPEAGCIKRSYGGHDYFICPATHGWAQARALCQLQASTDLVHIGDQGENDFVAAQIASNTWIAANDRASEGMWRWEDDGLQFWSSSGGAVAGVFSAFGSGEPNDSAGTEDCAVMLASGGRWSDQSCSALAGYVCEVQADQCPSDPSKTAPGQCGCGMPDTEADGDGTADCNDGCPNDAGKVTPGVCGCGAGELDGDADGTPDCHDGCPTDALKTAAGSCGCGNADTDSDMDGTPNCNDGCPNDAAHQAPPCGFSYMPSNFDPTALSFSADVNVNCNVTLTSVNNTNPVTICGTSITPVLQNQSTGPQLWILPMNSLSVSAGYTLKLNGTLPVVLAVIGNTSINGTIDASSTGSTSAGAGADVSCSTGTGAAGGGTAFVCANGGPGGGSGGSFGSSGGRGGGGGGIAQGGAQGALEGNAMLTPLRAGCAGGDGGANVSAGGVKGHGGGAVQISCANQLILGGAAIVAASGGGGSKNNGGGGGGSGGAILLEGRTISLAGSAWITANGGGGASGSGGVAGSDGIKTSTAQAAGGSGGAAGGKGSALAGAAIGGGNGSSYCDAGGGGGGGSGRIRIHAAVAGCSVPTAQISPAASIACP